MTDIPSNEVLADCDYYTADPNADASIVATRDVNNFRFYGMIAGPGIQINQAPTLVQLRQAPTITSIGKYVSLGTSDVNIGGNGTDYIPTLVVNGPGQYDEIGNVTPITGSYTASLSVSFSSLSSITIYVVDFTNNTQIMIGSLFNALSPNIATLSVSKTVDIPANHNVGVRINTVGFGILYLARSYFTLSTA